MCAAELVSSFEMAQLDSQNSSLNSIHSAVPANHGVVIFPNLPVIPQDPYFFLQFLVVGHHCASFTEGPEIFSGIEAEASYVAQGADLSPFINRSMGLRCIFDDKKTSFPGKFQYRIHVRRLTKEV